MKSKLEKWRDANSVSRKDLADRAGTSDVTIWRIETGEDAVGLFILMKVAEATRDRKFKGKVATWELVKDWVTLWKARQKAG